MSTLIDYIKQELNDAKLRKALSEVPNCARIEDICIMLYPRTCICLANL